MKTRHIIDVRDSRTFTEKEKCNVCSFGLTLVLLLNELLISIQLLRMDQVHQLVTCNHLTYSHSHLLLIPTVQNLN